LCDTVPFVRLLRLTLVASLFLPPALLAAAPARAEDNSAAMEALFAEGRRLMAENKYAEACPKFLASFKLDETRVGTLLNLADCYEKNGQLASAWARFVEARAIAARSGQSDRVAFASERAKALEPKLSKLTIAVAPEVAALPGLQVRRDGVSVDQGAWGVAVAVDGSPHTIEVSATGKKPLSIVVQVGQSDDAKEARIPRLEDVTDVPSEGKKKVSGRTVLELALVGVGVASLGVGTYFGVTALGKKSDANQYCGGLNGGPNDCTAEGVSLRKDAGDNGTLSTIFVGVGVAAIAAGAVLWLTTPKTGTRVGAGFNGRFLTIQGEM
jgi:hypothetical protein